MNSRSFNLHRDYSHSLTLSNVYQPSWSRISKNNIYVQKEKENFGPLVYVIRKTYREGISRRTCSNAVTAKKCTKKRNVRAEVVVLLIKPNSSLTFSLPLPSSDLSSPLRWLNTVLREVSGKSRDGGCFKLGKLTWRRNKQWYTEDDFSKSTH